jgi:acetolactate synthase regulatory subunit
MMEWLVALETDNNPIVLGRLMNAFRRKGVEIKTLTLGTRTEELSLMALVESAEENVEHMLHFLRVMVGVREVACYRHEPSGKASFIFMETDDHSKVTKILADFPLSKLVFASQGRYLVEVGEKGCNAGDRALDSDVDFLPFARVRPCSTPTQAANLPEA